MAVCLFCYFVYGLLGYDKSFDLTGRYKYYGKRCSSQLQGISRRYVAPKCVSAYPLR